MEKVKEKGKIERNYWKEEDENLLKQWSDKAQCYQWLHNKGREIYQVKNTWFSIPVIIISTLTGTTNFAQDRFSEESQPYVQVAIGTLSIIAGIISTIYQFLKISEINEGHRIATLSWGKFHRNLETELTTLRANYQNLETEVRDLEWKVEDFQARYISDLNNPSQDSQSYELMKWEWQDLLKKVTILETNQLETWQIDDLKNRIAYVEAMMHGH